MHFHSLYILLTSHILCMLWSLFNVNIYSAVIYVCTFKGHQQPVPNSLCVQNILFAVVILTSPAKLPQHTPVNLCKKTQKKQS